ncbi:MAG: hypothetical protein ACR2HN_02075, partial [Tepidiformaceae bacterium]
MAQCHSYVDGRACRMAARQASAHCIAHDPEYRDEQHANSTAGGVASADARRKLEAIDLDFVSLTDRPSIQALLDAVFRQELLGELPTARGRLLVRMLSLAIRNLDRASRNGQDDALIGAQDARTYDNVRGAFTRAAPNLLYSAHSNERGR